MGSWVWNLAKAKFGDVGIEVFGKGDGPYCFEKAVVMRHELEGMRDEKKLRVINLMRCKAREACGLDPMGRGKELNERGAPIIRLTLLMRRGARSFKNGEVVRGIFGQECERVEGCVLSVIQSEDLSFCDQVSTSLLFLCLSSLLWILVLKIPLLTQIRFDYCFHFGEDMVASIFCVFKMSEKQNMVVLFGFIAEE